MQILPLEFVCYLKILRHYEIELSSIVMQNLFKLEYKIFDTLNFVD